MLKAIKADNRAENEVWIITRAREDSFDDLPD